MIHLFIFIFIYLFTYLFVYLFIYLFINLLFYLFIHLFAYLSILLQVATKSKNSYMIRFLWDILLYRNASSLLPVLGVALTTATPFFSIYFFNFHYYTILIILCLLFLLEKIHLPTFVSSKTGLAWGIISTAEYSYFINVSQHYGSLINYIVLFIGISICFTLYKSATTKANSLSPDQNR